MMERKKAAKEEVVTLDKLADKERFYVVFPDGTIGSSLVYERVISDPKATAKRTDTGAMREFPLDTAVVRVSREAGNETLSTDEKSASAIPRPYESPLTTCTP